MSDVVINFRDDGSYEVTVKDKESLTRWNQLLESNIRYSPCDMTQEALDVAVNRIKELEEEKMNDKQIDYLQKQINILYNALHVTLECVGTSLPGDLTYNLGKIGEALEKANDDLDAEFGKDK